MVKKSHGRGPAWPVTNGTSRARAFLQLAALVLLGIALVSLVAPCGGPS